MKSNLIRGLTQELKTFCLENGGMVVYDTNLHEDITFSLPLIILEVNSAKGSERLPGGVTRMYYDICLTVYSQAPDSYIDDDTTDSTSHLDYGDLVRNYFENEVWATQLMVDLVNDHDFRLTYDGTVKAQNLKTKDATLKGFEHKFESVAYDFTVYQTDYMTETTQGITGAID
jgi:hypothetical protein